MTGTETPLILYAKLILLTMVPFVLAGQGTMIGGRTGVFNVAQEGIMLVCASVGFLVSFYTHSLTIGIIAAMAVGAIFGLALAYFTTNLKMDQFVIGLALFFIGLGLSTLLPKILIGVTLTPPLIPTLKEIPIPLLSKIPFIGEVFFNQNIMVYGSVLISVLLWWFMYKTSFGLSLTLHRRIPAGIRQPGYQRQADALSRLDGRRRVDRPGGSIPSHGVHGNFHRRYGERPRMAGNCPDLLRRLETDQYPVRFPVLCRRGNPCL